MTCTDAARQLGVSSAHIRKLCESGRITAHLCGYPDGGPCWWEITPESLQQWVKVRRPRGRPRKLRL